MNYSYISAQIMNNLNPQMINNDNFFFWNGRRNLFIYFEDIEKQKKHTKESIQKLVTIVEKDFPVIFYAQTPDAFIKIEAMKDQFSLYPLEPYCMKQGIDASEPNLDLEIYIKIALAFCENIAIFSLETRHLNTSDQISS